MSVTGGSRPTRRAGTLSVDAPAASPCPCKARHAREDKFPCWRYRLKVTLIHTVNSKSNDI